MMAEVAGPLFRERSERMTALDDRLRDGVRAIGRVDLLVGIPSYRNAATIGHVASSVSRGLREHFADAKVALVNADGGSQDGTPDRVVEAADGAPVAVGRPLGPPGRAAAFRAVFGGPGRLGAAGEA